MSRVFRVSNGDHVRLGGGISLPQNLHFTVLCFSLGFTTCSLLHLGQVRLRCKIVPMMDVTNGFID